MNEEKPSNADAEDETRSESFEKYQELAETVGMVPSLRVKDNAIQGVVTLVFALMGAIAGYIIIGTGSGVLACAAGGLISGVFLSGLVLMILGFTRKSKK